MKLDQLKKTTRQTVDELSEAARAHKALAKEQYQAFTDRHGETVERFETAVRQPILRTREQVQQVTQDVTTRTEGLAKQVNQRTSEITRTVGARAQELTREVNERTEDIAQTVLEQLPTKRPRQATPEPSEGTVDVPPAGTAPETDEDAEDATNVDDEDEASA